MRSEKYMLLQKWKNNILIKNVSLYSDFIHMSIKPVRYTLPKTERLCAQKRIDKLFSGAESFISYPLRIVYLRKKKEESEESSVSIMVSVSKKYFKRAVKRNRVKRLVREAYRLDKADFVETADVADCSFDIAFLYLKSELPTYVEIEKAVRKCITVLREKVKKQQEE